MPAKINKLRRVRNAFFRRPESSSADARNSNCSERESQKNLRTCARSCAAAPVIAARASQMSSNVPIACASKVHTNNGPSSRAVEKNSASV